MYHVIEDDPGIRMIGSVIEHDIPFRVQYGRSGPTGDGTHPRALRVMLEQAPVELPDLFVLDGNPVASRRMLDALFRAGVDNIEFLPAPVAHPDGTRDDYGVLNVLGLVKAIDHHASRYSGFAGRIVRMHELKLLRHVPTALRLFRPTSFRPIMLGDAGVAAALAGLSGVRVTPAQSWTDAHWF
jgi:hypothetical protein